MRKTLIQSLNEKPVTVILYPVLSFVLFFIVTLHSPVNIWWAAYKNHASAQGYLSLMIVLASLAAMVIGYFYFRLIFSNYWSSITFFVLLAMLDWQVALGFLLVITVTFFAISNADMESGYDRARAGISYRSRKNHFGSHVTARDSIDKFGDDFVVGRTTGVGFSTGSAAGSSSRDTDF